MSNSDNILRLGAFLPVSRVNGPGIRSVLWAQGCPFRCPGCFNPEFQDFSAGEPVRAGEIIRRILENPRTEGVTFSGGEPFAQARTLAEIAQAVRQAGKSLVIFTGYAAAELRENRDPNQQQLLNYTDLLIAGPYRQDQPGTHPLLASANQELVFLTDRYRTIAVKPGSRQIEYRIAVDGKTTTITGFPRLSGGIT